jgi:hypothetical protein
LDRKETLFRQGFRYGDVEGWHFASERNLIVSFLLLDEVGNFFFVFVKL